MLSIRKVVIKTRRQIQPRFWVLQSLMLVWMINTFICLQQTRKVVTQTEAGQPLFGFKQRNFHYALFGGSRADYGRPFQLDWLLFKLMLHWWRVNGRTVLYYLPFTHPVTPSMRLDRLQVVFLRLRYDRTGIWIHLTSFADTRYIPQTWASAAGAKWAISLPGNWD